MGFRNIWEDIYAVEVFPSGTSLSQITSGAPVFNGTSTKGVRGIVGTSSIYNLLPVDSHPTIKASSGVVTKELATGKALQNVVSRIRVTVKPEAVTVPVLFNAHNMSTFVKLFGQSGVTVANGTTNTALQIMSFVPYTDTEPIQYGNLVRFMQDSGESDAVDQLLKGIIVDKITLRGEEGGVIEGDVEFMGAKYDEISLAGTAVTGPLAKSKDPDTTQPFRFEDLTVIIGGQTVSVPKFELTLENNAIMKFYNEVAAKVVNLGKLNITGSLSIPWNDSTTEGKNKQISDFRNGVDKELVFIFGNPTGSYANTAPYTAVDCLSSSAKNSIDGNYMSIAMNVKIDDYNIEDLDGLPMLPINFSVLEDESNTNNGITLRLGYKKSLNTW